MRRAKNFLTPTALRTLYFAFIQSHLNYCPIILSSISQHNFNQIKLILKKAIRIITNSTYTAHTAPLFAQLQILPYEIIIKQAKLLFMHSIEYNYAPPSFSGIWIKGIGLYVMPTTIRCQTLGLNYSKNRHCIHCHWNGTCSMKIGTLETEQHLRLP